MRYAFNILAIALLAGVGYAQDAQKNSEATKDTKALLDSQRFEFVAESANPLKGRSIHLSPGYTFIVLPDSVVSDLPYYGRAFQASFDTRDAGIKFISTDFDYAVKPRKKNGWDISIKPKDVRHAPQIYLSVSTSGTGSLRISSVDRESISFTGYLRIPRKE